MFDHGLGHIVPRDAENVRLLSDVLETLIPGQEHQYKEGGSEEPEQPEMTGEAW